MQFQNGKSQWISREILGIGERRQALDNRISRADAQKWEGVQEGARPHQVP